MMNFNIGPMDRMQHQQGFAPNQPIGQAPMGQTMGQNPNMMGGFGVGPSPEILQKLMAMFQGGQNPGGQMPNGMPFGHHNKPPMMGPMGGGIGMSKPPMMGDPNRLGGEKFAMGPSLVDPNQWRNGGGIMGPDGKVINSFKPAWGGERPEKNMGTTEKNQRAQSPDIFSRPDVRF